MDEEEYVKLQKAFARKTEIPDKGNVGREDADGCVGSWQLAEIGATAGRQKKNADDLAMQHGFHKHISTEAANFTQANANFISSYDSSQRIEGTNEATLENTDGTDGRDGAERAPT